MLQYQLAEGGGGVDGGGAGDGGEGEQLILQTCLQLSFIRLGFSTVRSLQYIFKYWP
tara:strand:+ start:423 stop:593 length:171 start_codon:yes stop_codon:yes gene_type:complete